MTVFFPNILLITNYTINNIFFVNLKKKIDRLFYIKFIQIKIQKFTENRSNEV